MITLDICLDVLKLLPFLLNALTSLSIGDRLDEWFRT